MGKREEQMELEIAKGVQNAVTIQHHFSMAPLQKLAHVCILRNNFVLIISYLVVKTVKQIS